MILAVFAVMSEWEKPEISLSAFRDRFYSEMWVSLLDLPENFVRKLALPACDPFGTVWLPAVPYR